jgi:hypothetical protein
MFLSCGAGRAQTAPTPSGLGATSPLNALTSATSGAPTGIPLGATEINPGGLSPAPCTSVTSTSMGAASSQASLSTTSSSFDGGGLSPTSCNTGSSATVSSAGTASPLFTTGTSLAGGVIPLGATELNGTGVSPMIMVPTPSVTLTTAGPTAGATSTTTVQIPGVASTITATGLSTTPFSPCPGSAAATNVTATGC